MFDTVPEIEILPQESLKLLLVEASSWKSMTEDQQYHSNLYKLMSDLIEIYGSHVDIRLLVDVLSVECARRVTNQIKKKKV